MNIASQGLRPAIINQVDKLDDTLTLLLGFSKHLCRGFERNNIQMTGNWYLDVIETQAPLIDAYLKSNSPKFVNLVGTSKSCTGAFIVADHFARLYPRTIFRIFAFSAYTRLDRDYYERNEMLEEVPESLVTLWQTSDGLEQTERYKDAINLLRPKNIKAYMIYPARSRGPEPDAARRLSVLSNVALIPLKVRVHSVIFPFWKTLTPDAKVETFEGNPPAALKPEVFDYFHAMQTDPWYRFSLYTLIFETPRFRKEMQRFNKSHGDRKASVTGA